MGGQLDCNLSSEESNDNFAQLDCKMRQVDCTLTFQTVLVSM